MKTKKSAVEIQAKNLIKECNDIVDDSYLTTRDARKIIDLMGKMLEKVEELRKSRDNWRTKFERLKND